MISLVPRSLTLLLMPAFDEMVAKMVELRKGKMTDEQCRAVSSKGNYFGTMLVKMGKADCLLGGAIYPPLTPSVLLCS